ncbi:Protein ULTRAPETALA 1 [Capsicum annuum]|uniref:Protein ULTRAPETALA 1 n=1 Tax=Capsicum annuum TaxID=4072 RepID=A0A2G2Z3I6_CAPAN|nr:Protein ULTRAPETALA 1 [Capsicum annuum]
MENGSNGLFTEEELREISGVKKEDDYVEVMCGCTSHRYGDAVARLRVFSSGELEITCDCTPGCTEDKLTPAAFEKHSGRETARKWKNNIWIIVNGDKVPVVKTPLLKYYNQTSKHANGSNKTQNGRACHRDEFLKCIECEKERRFRLRSKEECRIYHDALANVHWKCSCIPYDKYVPLILVCYFCSSFLDSPSSFIDMLRLISPKSFFLIDQSYKIYILSTEWWNGKIVGLSWKSLVYS